MQTEDIDIVGVANHQLCMCTDNPNIELAVILIPMQKKKNFWFFCVCAPASFVFETRRLASQYP